MARLLARFMFVVRGCGRKRVSWRDGEDALIN